MESHEVKVTLTKDCTVNLDTDNPDLDSLVKQVVENRDSLDPEKIKVDCDAEDFDVGSFKEVIVKSIKDFQEAIKIDKDKFDAALESLKDSES